MAVPKGNQLVLGGDPQAKTRQGVYCFAPTTGKVWVGIPIFII